MYNLETIITETLAKTLCASASVYKGQGDVKMSKRLYLAALKQRKKLSLIDEERYQPHVAKTLYLLAEMYEENREYDLAIKYYKKSIFITKKMVKSFGEKHSTLLAQRYMKVANLCRRDYRYVQAERFYHKALKIYKNSSKYNYQDMNIDVLHIYQYLAIISEEGNRFEQAKEAYMSILKIYKSLVNDESDIYRDELAMTLVKLGTLYVKNSRQNRAGEVYLFALELLNPLYAKDSRYKETLAITLHNLAQIYTAQHEFSSALTMFREALNHYTDMADEEPSKYGPEVATLFKNLAFFYKKQNRKDVAQYFHLRSVELYRELSHYNSCSFEVILASTIIDGVKHFEQHTVTLYEAEMIIRSYEEESDLAEMLEKISCLRLEMAPAF